MPPPPSAARRRRDVIAAAAAAVSPPPSLPPPLSLPPPPGAGARAAHRVDGLGRAERRGRRSGSRRGGDGGRGRGRRRRCSRPSGTARPARSAPARPAWRAREISLPAAAVRLVGNDVERQAERMLAVGGVDGVVRVAVGDEDLVLADQVLDVGQQPPVDPLAGEPGDRHELAAAGRLAEVRADLLAPHLARRGRRERADATERRAGSDEERSASSSCRRVGRSRTLSD